MNAVTYEVLADSYEKSIRKAIRVIRNSGVPDQMEEALAILKDIDILCWLKKDEVLPK